MKKYLAMAVLMIWLVLAGAPVAAAAGCNQAAPEAVANVKLPGHPFSVVSSPDGCRLFVSLTSTDPKSNGVAVLRRGEGGITVDRVYPMAGFSRWNPLYWWHPLWPGPAGMALTHDGKLLITANYTDCAIYFWDVKAMTAGAADPLAGRLQDACSAGSFYVAVTLDDRLLFVSGERTETISVFDLQKARRDNFSGDALQGRITVGVTPVALALSPDGKWLYTTSEVAPAYWNWPPACPPERQFLNRNHEGAVIVIDVRRAAADPGHAVAARVPAGCVPVRAAVSADGRSLWVSARDGDEVLEFDTARLLKDPAHARTGSVPAQSPVGVALLPGGRRLVVANSHRAGRNVPEQSSTIAVVDTEKAGAGAQAILGSIPAGIFAREFAASPDGRTLFVTNYYSDALEVIDIDNLPRAMTAPAK